MNYLQKKKEMNPLKDKKKTHKNLLSTPNIEAKIQASPNKPKEVEEKKHKEKEK